MSKPDLRPNICDYEGSDYRTAFWEGKGRNYEDRVERVALRRLLPKQGRRLLEIGAGFGRLTQEYAGFEQVVLLDYSLSQLQYAQEQFGRDGRYVYVAADAYHLPFGEGVFDGATMVRVIHHIADINSVLAQVNRVLASHSVFVLEHANKRNLKAMVRYALKKQAWNPHDLAPVEFVELNFDFHPAHVQQALNDAGFIVEQRIPVSFFRLNALKQHAPLELLVTLDSLLQYSALLYSPSIFVRSKTSANNPDNIASDSIFACPECGGELVQVDDTMRCVRDELRWAVRDGIYDFKAVLEV